METIKLGALTCKVKRSRRKTLSIRACADGMPEIAAPTRLRDAEIVRLLIKYERKIAGQCEMLRRRELAREAFGVAYGSPLRFFGETVTVKPYDGVPYCDGTGFYLPSGLPSDALKHEVIALYKAAAREYITARAAVIAADMGLSPSAVKINSAKSHFASCSRRSSLNISWYCIMAPRDAVDYIIVHELCHMRHFDHSAKFWAEVARYCPDYKTHKKTLRTLSHTLSEEKWD